MTERVAVWAVMRAAAQVPRERGIKARRVLQVGRARVDGRKDRCQPGAHATEPGATARFEANQLTPSLEILYSEVTAMLLSQA